MIVRLSGELITITLAIFSAVIVPMSILVIKFVVKATRLEERLIGVISDQNNLHRDMDARVRWLEEHAWSEGGNRAVRNQTRR